MKAKTLRRIVGATAIVVGAFLMWLAPDPLIGSVMMAAGVALEIAGIALERG